MSALCQGCGQPLAPNKARGRPRKWCSEACRKVTLYSRRCVDCGAVCNTDGRVREAAIRCQNCCNSTPERRAETSRTFAGVLDWTDEEILDALRAAAVDGVVTVNRYGNRRPILQTIVHRFGSWNAAVTAAGLEHGASCRRSYNRISAVECAAAIAQCTAELGRSPSVLQYDAWSRGKDAPSHSTIRMRCGGWLKALEQVA